MKKISGILLSIGFLLIILSLAFPEGFKEEQPFIENIEKLEENEGKGGVPIIDKKAEASTAYENRLMLESEHVLLIGIFLCAAGFVCLAISVIKSNKQKQV